MRGRRLAALGLSLGLLAPALVMVLASGAKAAVTFDVINATVNAGADHVVGGSDAFPNFRTGAVDNYYPLAHARLDNSPSSEARASPADTGPVGQTGAATAGQAQPQYADVHFPPGSAKPVTFGQPGGPYAQASAGETMAASSATAASTRAAALPGGVGAGTAASASLRPLLLAWRHHYLTADDAARWPMPAAAAAAEPDGVDGGASSAVIKLDQTASALVETGDARVNASSFGSGAISLRGVHVGVTITNDGKPRHTIAIEVSGATVGGVPVTIGADGVSVMGSQVPGLTGANQQADDALNGSLAQAGFKVFTVAPQIKSSGHQETIEASGVHVVFAPAPAGNGVPTENADQVLGEVFVDSLAVPAEAIPGTGAVGGSTAGEGAFLSPTGPQTIFIPGTPATPGTPGSAVAGTTRKAGAAPKLASATTRAGRPLWLLLLYFLWQSVLIGTVASLYWRRTGLPS